ncbi:uncharacterized protein AKAME5_001948800 [Lates japonicus]|uniref:Uncharacterized protein n=1 Tax=Lates japonicus TaxID=270547 RepID=A0AAD3RH53_LATJO|nr:uncharacterized protein AKAME5_001948800 [Lates japonicus]
MLRDGAFTVLLLLISAVSAETEDSGSTVSFQNPLHFYKELKQATKPDTYFDFSVSSDNGSLGKTKCQSTEPICRFDFSFPEGVEECVTLVGWLMTGQRTDWVAFNKTGHICRIDSTDVHWVILAVVLGGLVLVITAVTISICFVKAWTMNSLPHPDLKDWNPSNHEQSLMDSSNSSGELDLNRPCYRTGRLLEGSSQELDAERDVTDEESADGSEKTECVSIGDEEEVERKGGGHYDCRPQILPMDMGDGDMVETYSQR